MFFNGGGVDRILLPHSALRFMLERFMKSAIWDTDAVGLFFTAVRRLTSAVNPLVP